MWRSAHTRFATPCASLGAHRVQARNHRGPPVGARGLERCGRERLRLARGDLLLAAGLRDLPVRNPPPPPCTCTQLDLTNVSPTALLVTTVVLTSR